MFKTIRSKLSLKIFLSFLSIMLITVALDLIFGFYFLNSAMEQEIQEQLKNNIEGYKNQLNIIEKSLLTIAVGISRDTEIKNLLLQHKNNKLKEKLVKLYRLGIADILEIENGQGKVLARGHHPGLKGDIKYSQDIIKKGLEGAANTSYERGNSGLAIRAVAPVISDKKVVGLVMAGNSFSQDLVEHCHLLSGLTNGIYKNNSKIVSTYSGYDNIEKSVIKKLEKNRKVFLRDVMLDNQKYYLILKPLFLDSKYWGCLSMGISNAEAVKELVYSQKFVFLFLGIGILISLFIYLYLARYIHNSLKQIITPVNNIRFDNFDSNIILKSSDEFGIIAESINNMIKKIRLYNERLKRIQNDMLKTAKINTAGQLAAGIAHEIRNPLSSVKMMVQLVKKRYLQGEKCKEVEIILTEVERINNLVKELLEFSKPSGLHFSMNNINDIMTRVLEIFRYNIEHQKILAQGEFEQDIPMVYIDNEKMTLVFINLIINAIQAMPDGGNLNIKTERCEGNRIMVSVKNSDYGLDTVEIDKLFEPFYTTKKSGTGLGLALAKSIVDRHNGELQVSKGQGVICFSVFIPVKMEVRE